jgi:hypothetical protein
MTDLLDPNLNGHKSASQRREEALKVEAMRMRILADHLRALVVLLLEERGTPFVVSKEIIAQHLGLSLVSSEDPITAMITFSLPPKPADSDPTEEIPAIKPA